MRKAQKKLLARLRRPRLDDATAFVLLWTYFDSVGLSDVESSFIGRSLFPQKIDPFPLRTDDAGYDPAAGLAELESALDASQFDQKVAAWLKGLDALLVRQKGTFEHCAILGFDRKRYRVRQRNQYIASRFAQREREIEGSQKQSLSLTAYCRNFCAVPAELIRGFRIRSLGPTQWGDRSVDDRLRVAAKESLRFLCWPLRSKLIKHRDRAETRPGDNDHWLVRLTVDTEGGVEAHRRELARAVEAAARERAAILVLPELSTATKDVEFLRSILTGRQYPILTIAGIEHRRRGKSYVNEAVLLGPHGKLLHTHRKLTRYKVRNAIERTLTGKTLTVLESVIGNICPLICLDLFHPEISALVRSSHANILLTPSLSPTTTAHQNAAKNYLNTNLATTLVSNRCFKSRERKEKTTFALLPGKDDANNTIWRHFELTADYLLVVVE